MLNSNCKFIDGGLRQPFYSKRIAKFKKIILSKPILNHAQVFCILRLVEAKMF